MPAARALSLFFLILMMFFGAAVVLVVHLHVNRFITEGLDEYLMRDMLSVRVGLAST